MFILLILQCNIPSLKSMTKTRGKVACLGLGLLHNKKSGEKVYFVDIEKESMTNIFTNRIMAENHNNHYK